MGRLSDTPIGSAQPKRSLSTSDQHGHHAAAPPTPKHIGHVSSIGNVDACAIAELLNKLSAFVHTANVVKILLALPNHGPSR